MLPICLPDRRCLDTVIPAGDAESTSWWTVTPRLDHSSIWVQLAVTSIVCLLVFGFLSTRWLGPVIGSLIF